MKTYYLSFHCKPSPSHPEAVRYSGMVADLFITSPSEDGVEERALKHLEGAGWIIEVFEHAELVERPSEHDTRFAELFRTSRTSGIASIFSPF